jgi:hypothetical protein
MLLFPSTQRMLNRRLSGSEVAMKKTVLWIVLCLAVIVIVPDSFGQVAITHMFGPLNPAPVDVAGLFTATPSGPCAVPMRTGTTLSLFHPWSDIPATGTLCGFNAVTGKYTAICRTTPGGLTQMISVTGFSPFRAPGKTTTYSVPTYPSSFSYTETGTPSPKNGTGTLVDQNGDGIFDGIALTGGSTNITLPFVYVDINGDGFADYVSLPWSQAALFGINPNGGVLAPGAGGKNPQIWVPLADTNGDGKGDSIVFDLTGSGVPDPDLYSSPAMGPVRAPASVAPPIPTFSEWGVLWTVLALTLVGLWQLKIHAVS